ncbi:hypothetical protein PT974_08747 [Cladobotryum mycophilum]|uniref:Uncharacterized protein n=1 Tax=Cladobotryum mycophilum TaxID=491253 RepID=A0ABR0SEB8_9HYPO
MAPWAWLEAQHPHEQISSLPWFLPRQLRFIRNAQPRSSANTEFDKITINLPTTWLPTVLRILELPTSIDISDKMQEGSLLALQAREHDTMPLEFQYWLPVVRIDAVAYGQARWPLGKEPVLSSK